VRAARRVSPTGTPDAPLGGDVRPAGRHKKTHTLALHVVPPSQQASRDDGGRVEEISIREDPLRSDDRNTVTARF